MEIRVLLKMLNKKIIREQHYFDSKLRIRVLTSLGEADIAITFGPRKADKSNINQIFIKLLIVIFSKWGLSNLIDNSGIRTKQKKVFFSK
jgi:hypothetical protein